MGRALRPVGASLLLLVVVVAAQYGYRPLALLYPDPALAARWISYTLRGYQGALTGVLLAWLGWRYIREPTVLALWLLGAMIMAFEEALIGVCGTIKLGEWVPSLISSSQCEDIAGPKAYHAALGVTVVVAWICYQMTRTRRC